jgi:hypothetical protein
MIEERDVRLAPDPSEHGTKSHNRGVAVLPDISSFGLFVLPTPHDFRMKNANAANEAVLAYLSGPELSEDDQTYHPSFAFSDADIVLRSTDSIFFRVHSHILRMTCGFFRDMLSLPQGAGSRDQRTPISVDETGIVLERFFEIIYCMESPTWTSRIDVQDVLLAAEKYQARGMISRLRPLLLTPLFTDSPLALYSLAARLDLEAEAKYASILSLSFYIYDTSHEHILRTIPSNYLTRLFILHEKRKRLFCDSMNDDNGWPVDGRPTNPFVHLNRYNTPRCCNRANDAAVVSWQRFQTRILVEMNKRPLGDTVTGEGMTNWTEAKNCWQMKCTACSRFIFDMGQFVTFLKTTLNRLPSTI